MWVILGTHYLCLASEVGGSVVGESSPCGVGTNAELNCTVGYQLVSGVGELVVMKTPHTCGVRSIL